MRAGEIVPRMRNLDGNLSELDMWTTGDQLFDSFIHLYSSSLKVVRVNRLEDTSLVAFRALNSYSKLRRLTFSNVTDICDDDLKRIVRINASILEILDISACGRIQAASLQNI